MKHNMNVDLTGKKFGRWTILSRANDRFTKSNIKIKMWHCVCDCGTTRDVSDGSLKRGKSLSCGCYNKEVHKNMCKTNFSKTHKHTECGSYAKIFLDYNKYFIVDKDDLEITLKYHWYISTSGYVRSKQYDSVTHKRYDITLHRMISGAPDEVYVDHINRDKLDNRKSNLRFCTKKQNNYNKTSNKQSGYVGVQERYSRYRASITKDGKWINLGTFDTKEGALIARLKAEKEYFGEFAPQSHLFEQYGI